MNTLQTIIALVFLPSSIVGGIVFVLRKLFEQGLARDIEKFKATLQTEFEHTKLCLENELQTKFFEFQTKFSLYHHKQVEVIEELYEMLCETEWMVSGLLPPVGGGDETPIGESVAEADKRSVALARFYGRKRIYLDEDVCQKMDTILKTMRKALVRLSVHQMSANDTRMWLEGWKVMQEEFPPLKEVLERQLRGILSALSISASNSSRAP